MLQEKPRQAAAARTRNIHSFRLCQPEAPQPREGKDPFLPVQRQTRRPWPAALALQITSTRITATGSASKEWRDRYAPRALRDARQLEHHLGRHRRRCRQWDMNEITLRRRLRIAFGRHHTTWGSVRTGLATEHQTLGMSRIPASNSESTGSVRQLSWQE